MRDVGVEIGESELIHEKDFVFHDLLIYETNIHDIGLSGQLSFDTFHFL